MAYKQSPINFGKGTGSFGANSPLRADGKYPHDKGYNTDVDEYNNPVGGDAYTYDDDGYQAFATDQKEQFGITNKSTIDEAWGGYMEDAPSQTPDVNTGSDSGMSNVQKEQQQIDQNIGAVNVSPRASAAGNVSSVDESPRRKITTGKGNYQEALGIGTYEKYRSGGQTHSAGISWRQKRRLLGGGAKSDRQLKRLRNQQRRKDQRAKNRRERGWGGFGWNWRKNK